MTAAEQQPVFHANVTEDVSIDLQREAVGALARD